MVGMRKVCRSGAMPSREDRAVPGMGGVQPVEVGAAGMNRFRA
jgi:hypothetical protein